MVVVPPPPLEGMADAPAVPLDPGVTVCEVGELSPADAQAARLREKHATTAPLALNQRWQGTADETLMSFNPRAIIS